MAPVSALGGGDLWPQISRRIGRGATAYLPGPPTRQADHARAIATIHDNLRRLLPGAPEPGPRVEVGETGLLASVFPDRILLYNGTEKDVKGKVTLAGAGWGAMVGAPAAREVAVQVDAHAIGEIRLGGPQREEVQP